jgi:hypothetical protein
MEKFRVGELLGILRLQLPGVAAVTGITATQRVRQSHVEIAGTVRYAQRNTPALFARSLQS